MQKNMKLLIFIFPLLVLIGTSYAEGEPVPQECKSGPPPTSDNYFYQEETCEWVQEHDYEVSNINKFVDEKQLIMKDQLDKIFGKHWEYKYQVRTGEGQADHLPNILCDLISVNGTENKYKVFENGIEHYVTLPVSLKIENPQITLHDSRPDNCHKFGKLVSLDWEQYMTGYDFVYRIAAEGHGEPKNPNKIYKIFYKMHNGTVTFFESLEGNGFAAFVHGKSDDILEIKIPRNYPHTNYDKHWDWMAIQTIKDENYEINFEIEKTRCLATFLIPVADDSKIEVFPGYNLGSDPFHGDNMKWYCDRFDDVHLPPYKQLDIEIERGEVWCKEGLDKFWRDGDKPVCVSHNTKAKLLQRDWGTLQSYS